MRIETTDSINKTVIINIISAILLKGIDFVTTPIFTRLLGADNYGKYAIYMSWASIFVCFMGGNVQSSVGPALYEYKQEFQKYKRCVFLIGLGICGMAICVGALFSNVIIKTIGFSKEIVILLLIYSTAFFVIEYAQNCFIYEKKVIPNFILSFLLAFISLGLSIFLVVNYSDSMKYLGRIEGVSFSYTIIAFLLMIFFLYKKEIVIDKSYVLYGLSLGTPIIFHLLSHNILNQSDRIVLKWFCYTDSDIGIYSLFCTYVAVLRVILSSLNNSWCPFFYDDLANKDYKLIDRKAKNYIELFTVVVCGFILLSREVAYVYSDPTFWSGIKYIPLVVLSVYFVFLYQFSVNIEFFFKKTRIIAGCSILAAVINIVLNIIVIPQYGVMGAAITTALSYALLWLFHYLYVAFGIKCYYVSVVLFIKPLIYVCAVCVLFYIAKELYVIRWLIGIGIGMYEIVKIFRRKSFFGA